MDSQQLLAAIKACQEGNSQEFGKIYDLYIRKIYNYLYYRVMHQPTAEDLTSVTFFKALDHINNFQTEKGTFQAWLYRIARNTLIDHFRTAKEVSSLEQAAEIRSKEDLSALVGDKLLLEQVREFIFTLPAEQKDLVIMRVWDGLSYSEIAQISGRTESALKMSVADLKQGSGRNPARSLDVNSLNRNLTICTNKSMIFSRNYICFRRN